ncbi:MAG: hypothetical protein K8S98_11860 [Planctomycetes bacterium]|nr:hypothetical protein [Planctomycetota bacterium]
MTPHEAAPHAEKKLLLYVAGNSSRALTAMDELRRFVDERRREAWHLEVVDVLHESARDSAADVLMTPTLVATVGGVERRIIGRFDELGNTLDGLGEGSET